jgi:hypothetical protein
MASIPSQVHPSAVGTGTIPSTDSERAPQPPAEGERPPRSAPVDQDKEAADSGLPGEDYPEQKHAGKIGYGPNYNQGAVSPVHMNAFG